MRLPRVRSLHLEADLSALHPGVILAVEREVWRRRARGELGSFDRSLRMTNDFLRQLSINFNDYAMQISEVTYQGHPTEIRPESNPHRVVAHSIDSHH
ncbi:MAG: hypothetical protein GY939_11105 [Actinomycetia bacterium]|nr:hypothetical protein [Actinomycetes bacterium]